METMTANMHNTIVLGFRPSSQHICGLILIFVSTLGISSATCPGPPDCYICKSSQAVCKLCPEDQGIPETVTDLKLMADGCSTLRSIGLLKSTSFSRYPDLERLNLNHVNVMRFFGSVFYSNSKLRVLSMAQNKIRSFGSSVFKGLGNLEELNLAQSQVRVLIPASFKELTGLKDLNLVGNFLEKLSEHDFDGLQSLESLHVSSNPINAVELNTFQTLTHIQTIDFANSQMTVIPDKLFANLASLKNLDLSGSNITRIEPGSLSGTALDSLNLANNHIPAIPSSTIKQTTQTPRTINLGNNTISRITNGDLSGVNMDTVDLHNNPITIVEANAFSGSVIKNIDLRGTRLSSLPASMEASLTRGGTSLNLDGLTSWRCDCTVLWLGRHLLASAISKSPTCGGGSNKWNGRQLTAIMPALEADCRTTTTSSTTTSTTTTTTTSTTTPKTSTTTPTTSTSSTTTSTTISKTAPSTAAKLLSKVTTKTATTKPTTKTPVRITQGHGPNHAAGTTTPSAATNAATATDSNQSSEEGNQDDTVHSILVVLVILCVLVFCLAVVAVITACAVCKRQGVENSRVESANIVPTPSPMTIGWKGRMEAIHTF